MYSTIIDETTVSEDRLPKPQGYKILVAMPKVEEKTSGGLHIPQELQSREEVASIVGRVVALGPEAYGDPKRTSYNWCKAGDWIIFRSYSGTRFLIDRNEYRLINDDTVEAVVDNPRGYKRV